MKASARNMQERNFNRTIQRTAGLRKSNFLRSSPSQISARSGKKKEPRPKLFGPDIFQWGRGLPREGVGAKKFGMSLETREIKLVGRDIPGFCRDNPEEPEKFEKKRFGFNSPSPTRTSCRACTMHPRKCREETSGECSWVYSRCRARL